MKPVLGFPLALFGALFLHGALLGPTDDEAYYWVLAQSPAWAYTYHPPAVAWIIALTEFLFGWSFRWFGEFPSAALVRLPAAASAALVLWVGLRWAREAGVSEERLPRFAWVFMSFAGFFGTAWMMVPDIPLFAGLLVLFYCAWKVCFGQASNRILVGITAASALVMLSKYSGILALGSAGLSVLIWAPRKMRERAIAAIAAGGLLAAIPVLIWNAQTGWDSLLYQLRDRHQDGSLSWVRYVRFWAVQLVLAGPPLVYFAFRGWTGRTDQDRRVAAFVLLWVLPPALIFFVQPLWSDFKAHWAFVVWLPLAMRMAREAALGRVSFLARAQVVYGFSLMGIALLACHLPLIPTFASVFSTRPFDARWDVTNDMYGWAGLREFVRERAGEEALGFPVAGSRYQTASQAAFAWGNAAQAAKLPVTEVEVREWADLRVSDSRGPGWPRLTRPLIFVADSRYTAAPRFRGAHCENLGDKETRRGGFPAKSVRVWLCRPRKDEPA